MFGASYLLIYSGNDVSLSVDRQHVAADELRPVTFSSSSDSEQELGLTCRLDAAKGEANCTPVSEEKTGVVTLDAMPFA